MGVSLSRTAEGDFGPWIERYVEFREAYYPLDKERVQLLGTCIEQVQHSRVGYARHQGALILFGVACGIHFHRANLPEVLNTIPEGFKARPGERAWERWERLFLYEIAEFLVSLPRRSFMGSLFPCGQDVRYRKCRHVLLRSYRAEKPYLLAPALQVIRLAA